jgi:hypothetical protein
LVLQTQYSLSSSAATARASSSSSSGFSEPSGPTEPPGMTEVERERETDAATEPLFRDMADGALAFGAAGPAPATASETFPFGLRAGFARGLAAAAALGFGAGCEQCEFRF